jgi:hypothetical protein
MGSFLLLEDLSLTYPCYWLPARMSVDNMPLVSKPPQGISTPMMPIGTTKNTAISSAGRRNRSSGEESQRRLVEGVACMSFKSAAYPPQP